MLEIKVGDIFKSEAQTLVNTVNCVGVMGRGIALGFKKRFPDMYKDYVHRCKENEVKLGVPYIYKSIVPPWILNFPTKDHWRSFAKIEDITNGLEYLLNHYQEWGITSIAVPPLGTGLGQLDWRIVGPLLYRYLSRMVIPVEIFAPHGTPNDELLDTFLKGEPDDSQLPLKTPQASWVQPAWVALVAILERVLAEPYRWPVGRTMFQKMAYVATTKGLPLGLDFKKGSYGPHATNLRGKLTRLQNNGLIQEYRVGRMFEVRLGSTYKEAYLSYSSELDQWKAIIDDVADLFIRVNTRQAELLASVLFSNRQLLKDFTEPPSEQEVVDSVTEWKFRHNKRFLETEIASTVRNLAALGWLDVKASRGLKLPVDELDKVY